MKPLTYLIVTIATAAFFLLALANHNESAANRAYAEAAVIRASGQARADMLAAALPYVALVGIMVFGAALFLGLVIVALKSQAGATGQGKPGQLIIERHTIVILPPRGGRREMWQRIGESKLIEGK